MHADAVSGPAGAAGAAEATASAGGLADVLRMLDKLPLSDADKAEAVRRLLGDAR